MSCEPHDRQPAGLYVHVPFCARACPYCDFDFEVGALDRVPAYLQGIARQVQHAQTQGWAGFDTIYLGGGTPSMLSPQQLQELFAVLEPLAAVAAMNEVTVEFNPEHAAPELMGALVGMGVGRVSLGVQSFDHDGLVSLGRAHRAKRALSAIKDAQDAGLEVSCDLMVGWPGQDAVQLQRDLQVLIDTGVPHVSIYALTIEAGSNWPGLVKRGLRQMPDGDVQADLLERVHDCLVATGYSHYEVASYALGDSLARHNAKYWSAQDYLGLGPSAHSARYDAHGAVHRWGQRRGLGSWLQDPVQPEHEERLCGEASAAEALWLGLRRLDGVGLAAFERRFAQIDRAWILERTASLRERGLLELHEDRLIVAPNQWLMHDEIAHTVL